MANAEQEKPKITRRVKSRIPTFKTLEEEAAFWDAHDSTEFEDEFEDVKDAQFVKAKPKKAITVRLDEDTLATLARHATDLGIGPSTLARMWIRELLREREKREHPSQTKPS